MKKVLLGVVLFMALPVFAEEAVSSKFLGTFWALVPPLVAITLALPYQGSFFVAVCRNCFGRIVCR